MNEFISTEDEITSKEKIKELEKKLHELEESENRYKTLLKNAQVGIYRTTPAGQIIMVNPRLLEILGFDSLGELLSRNLEQKGFNENIPRRKFKEILKQKGEVKNFESIWEKKDGTEVYIRENARELRDEFGKVIYYDGTVEDITDLKLANKKIAEQAALLDIATDAIFVIDLNDNIIFWNKSCEDLYGWDSNHAIDKKSKELIYRQENITGFDSALNATKEKSEWTGELTHFTKDNELIFVESRWTLVLDEFENPKSIFVVNTDITEKKQLEAQFYSTQKMESLGKFAGGIAHNLNNIFQPLIMSLEVLKYPGNKQNSFKLLEMIESSSERSQNLVRQVLSFAKGIDGITEKFSPVNIKNLFNEVEFEVKEIYPDAINLMKHFETDQLNISGNKNQLKKILINLVKNAYEAMPEGGEIRLSAENTVVDKKTALKSNNAKIGNYILISVSDSGEGIDPKIINKIFEPFFTTKVADKFMGLGLSTVYGIVKSHGGFINVESEVGGETKFSIYLPSDRTTKSTQLKFNVKPYPS